MASALQDALYFLIDEALRIAKLCPYVPNQRMTCAVSGPQVRFVLGQVGVLRAEADD